MGSEKKTKAPSAHHKPTNPPSDTPSEKKTKAPTANDKPTNPPSDTPSEKKTKAPTANDKPTNPPTDCYKCPANSHPKHGNKCPKGFSSCACKRGYVKSFSESKCIYCPDIDPKPTKAPTVKPQ